MSIQEMTLADVIPAHSSIAALMEPNPNQHEPIPLALTGLGPVTPRSMTVCSVHFKTMKLRFFHSNRRFFVMPPPPKGKYSVLKFYDSQQAVQNTENGNSETRDFLPMPVSVESIAQDFRANWCQGYIGPMGKHPPGIDIIAGEIPTEAEFASLNARQERMCRALVEEADAIEKGTLKGSILDDHRKALEWMGSEKRSWYRPIEAGYSKTSVITGNRIPMEALADGGQDILEYYVKYDLDPTMYGDDHAAKLFEHRPDMKQTIRRRLGLVAPGVPSK